MAVPLILFSIDSALMLAISLNAIVRLLFHLFSTCTSVRITFSLKDFATDELTNNDLTVFSFDCTFLFPGFNST